MPKAPKLRKLVILLLLLPPGYHTQKEVCGGDIHEVVKLPSVLMQNFFGVWPFPKNSPKFEDFNVKSYTWSQGEIFSSLV